MSGEAMRDDIKQIATQLLIQNGYRGLRFGDIADRLGTTRANIHYHFGTKEKLIEEVIAEYVTTTLDLLAKIWNDPDLSFRDKATAMLEFNRNRYNRYNETTTGRPWSLISRMRLEGDLLTETGTAALGHFTKVLNNWVMGAVLLAQDRGELDKMAPTADIAVQLMAIIDSAGSITMDAGSFDRLEHLYRATILVIGHAYGGTGIRPNAMPDRPATATEEDTTGICGAARTRYQKAL